MDLFIGSLIIALVLGVIAYTALAIRTERHARRHGTERMLDFFVLGDCTPPATPKEKGLWLAEPTE